MTDIESLLLTGANANTKNAKNFTLLMSFAMKKDLKSVDALIRYGASVNDKDYTGYSAIDYCIEVEALEIMKYLVKNGAKISSDNYMLAINKNKKDIVKYFDTLDPNKHVFLQIKN